MMIIDNQLLYNEAEHSSALANGGCGICKRMGFPLFLVRKTIIAKKYREINWLQNLLSLGDNEKALSDTYEYAYRTLRTGYVYILVQEHDKTYRYLGYEVTPSGVFRHKSISDMVEHNIHEIPQKCTNKHDHIPGMFINIDRSRYSGIAYIGYSRRAWSQHTLDLYRLAANKRDIKQLRRFTMINLGEFASKAPSPEALGTVPLPAVFNTAKPPSRCFTFKDLDPSSYSFAQPKLDRPKLMELELDHSEMIYVEAEQTLEQALASRQYRSDGFVTAHKFNSFKGNSLRSTLLYSNQTNLVVKLFQQAATLSHGQFTDLSAVVIDDPFAIAEELSLQRKLYVDPIIDIVENSTSDFNDKITEVFKERINSQQDIDRFEKLFKQAIYNFYENYPEDANAIYGNKENVLADIALNEQADDNKHSKLDKLSYFYRLDKKMSYLYWQPYQNDREYFSEKSLHLRKIVEMIENYKTQLRAYFENQEAYKYTKAYTTTNGQNIANGSIYYENRPDLYEEVKLSENDKQRLLDEAKDVSVHFNVINVRIFKIKSGMSQEGENKLKEELDKLNKHINDDKLQDFIKQNNHHFTRIANTVAKYSTDYFNYLGWLFGAEVEGSPYLPNLKIFNQIPFWQDECDQNGSNNHLGYLQDFIMMSHLTVVGGVPLVEQYGVWDVLLSHKNSLFYQLFNTDSERSFWHLLVKARLAQDSDSQLAIEDKTLDNAIDYVQTHHNKVLDATFCENKGRIMTDLYEFIIQQSITGVAQKRDQTSRNNTNQQISEQGMTLPTWPTGQVENRMDEKAYKTLLCESLMVFNKTYAYFGQVSVPKYQASEFLRNWSVKPRIFVEQNDIQTFELLNSIARQRTVGDGSYELSEKTMEEFTFDIFDMANNIGNEFEWKNGLLQMKQGNIGFNSLDGMVKAYTDEFKNVTRINDTVEAGRAALLNSISLLLSVMSLNTNLAKLEMAGEAQYGQKYKDQLQDEIRKGYLTVTSQSLIAVNAISQATIKGVTLVKFLHNKRDAVRWVNAVIKSKGIVSKIVMAAKFAGGVLSIMAIIDGLDGIKSGSALYKDGEKLDGIVMGFCAGAQTVIAIIGLLQAFNIVALAGPWGGALFISTVLFAILTYIFRDKSLDWVPIEFWANRTLLGINYKNKKWPPYPPSLLGTGIATNDYLAAIQGMHCNIEYGVAPEAIYFDKMAIVEEKNAEIDRQFSQLSPENWGIYAKNTSGASDMQLEIYQQAIPVNSGWRSYTPPYAVKQLWLTNAKNYDSKGLYVQMVLPNYDIKISKLEAFLHLSKGVKTMILSITNGKDYPDITPIFGELSTVALRGENKEPIRDLNKNNTDHVTKIEFYETIKIPDKDTVTGLINLTYDENNNPLPILTETSNHKITYKVAEIYSDHEIYLKVSYWQAGKSKQVKDPQGNTEMIELSPLVQVYHYQKD